MLFCPFQEILVFAQPALDDLLLALVFLELGPEGVEVVLELDVAVLLQVQVLEQGETLVFDEPLVLPELVQELSLVDLPSVSRQFVIILLYLEHVGLGQGPSFHYDHFGGLPAAQESQLFYLGHQF